jgi:hypothetical protein
MQIAKIADVKANRDAKAVSIWACVGSWNQRRISGYWIIHNSETVFYFQTVKMIVIYDVVEQERLLMLKMLNSKNASFCWWPVFNVEVRPLASVFRYYVVFSYHFSRSVHVQEFTVTDMLGVPKIV